MRTILFSILVVLYFISCGGKNKNMPGANIKKELAIIDSLLRSKEYSYEMAKELNAGFDHDEEEQFITDKEETALVQKSVKEQKIAASIAGFYALECGLGLLYDQTKHTPVEWLRKIVNNSADSNTVLLLGRFANATWKAGQPFRDLNRITRYNFLGAGRLFTAEIKKDYDQVFSAAEALLKDMDTLGEEPVPEQMNQLKIFLQDTTYAFKMAKYLDSCYHVNQREPVDAFLTRADEKATILKSVKEQKIATSIAGFYALECGINYLVTTRHLLPSDILASILNDSISKDDKLLFLRFANATWKAGQPFRGLKRITRETFVPAYFLTQEDVDKDLEQIKTAARKLLATVRSKS